MWNNGSSDSSITVSSGGTFSLTVTDGNGCKGSDSIVIGIDQCLFGAYFPNAFTPNGDGHNDVFKPVMLGTLLSYRMMIFNRYGQLVFRSSDSSKGWDGTSSGVLQDSGTYVWSCSYQFAGNTPKNEKGTVVLIR
jgi:gliding motility-associated-like protein